MELKLNRQRNTKHKNKAFNRTIVELKPAPDQLPLEPSQPFNRTIVELKRILRTGPASSDCTFNRTIVELKPRIPAY